MKIFALVSTQGTAAAETALCERHLALQHKIVTPNDVAVREWRDCTGNDALSCMECGYPTIPNEEAD